MLYYFVLVLQYGCTICTLTKHQGKKLDRNYTKMVCVVLKKFWKQHLTKQQLYGHSPPISQTIQSKTNKTLGTAGEVRTNS